jgi:membrane-associated phospholipid phosphatase
MNIFTNLYNEIGHYGPGILIFLSLFLLWNHQNLFFYYIVGILFDSVLNIILKGLIQQPRPNFNSREFNLLLKNNKRFIFEDGIPYDIFGMPSGHSSSVIFSTFFVYFALRKTNWLYLYLLISAITISERVINNHHTIYQVLVGTFVGLFVAYLFYEFAENKIKGRIREKKDDDGPL